MTYLITDWMNNVCFDSDSKDFKTDIDASDYLDECITDLIAERCANGECECLACAGDCNCFEEEREEYWIAEYREDIDRLMWVGNRYVLKSNYYEVSA